MSFDETQARTPVRLPDGARIAAVISRYHAGIVDPMVASARATLAEAGLAPERFEAHEVSGAFEIPIVAQRLAQRGDIDAVLTFGLVLKGETDHDRHIARSVSSAIMEITLATGVPVLFGILTCGTMEQAEIRSRPAGEGGLDKGREVAGAAIQVLSVLRGIDSPGDGESR